jgi:hypothetical protein
MRSFIRATKLSLIAAAIAICAVVAPAHAGSYQDVVSGPQMVQGTNGDIYLTFQAGGYNWYVPSTDPGFSGYTTMVMAAWQKGHHIQIGCVSCYSINLVSPALSGNWPVWYPQWVTELPF